MSRRGAILWLLAWLCLPGATVASRQADATCVVADPSGAQLNVRAAPNGPIRGTLPNGNGVRVVGSAERDGKSWAQVASLNGEPLGWVFRSYLACQAAAAPAARLCTIADPTATPLNVRDVPGGAVRGTLANGLSVRVLQTQLVGGERWARVADPSGRELGWVFGRYTRCGEVPPTVAAVPRAPAEAGPPPSMPASPPRVASTSSEPSTAAAPTTPRVAAVPIDPGKRVALVVGNGRYVHSPELTNPANDAADVAAALRGLGFTVVEGRDLDFQALRTTVRDFSAKLAGADLALFFYAGHGVQVGGKNYLIPVDAKLQNAGDLDIDALDIASVLRAMEAEDRVSLVLLDACRDNPFTRSLARSLGTRSATVRQGLAEMKSGSDTLIAFATSPDAVALDGDGGRNSPFTAALLGHIGKPGLGFEAMMREVRFDVLRLTKNAQRPWTNTALSREVFLQGGPGR